jgi:hypothetical protein
MASAIIQSIIGETVMTNERLLNKVLQQVSAVINRRDLAPLDKIETVYEYLTQKRREILGKVDKN